MHPPIFILLFTMGLFLASPVQATICVGVGKCDITPPIGTPSAGYAVRQGRGMSGTHDPLLANAMVIDNGDQVIAFCAVDHLGFTFKMTQQILANLQSHPLLKNSILYVGSSHTHSGGGAYLDIPIVGSFLAGDYSQDVEKFYVDGATHALVRAASQMQPAMIGVGYGEVEDGLTLYRSAWPPKALPEKRMTILKATALDGSPLGVLFAFPMHPTVLGANNTLFSADFVGYAREEIQQALGDIRVLYFNGAQAEILPNIDHNADRFAECCRLGQSLAANVINIWNETEASHEIECRTAKESYSFVPQATPFGMQLPLDIYESEVNAFSIGGKHVFVTIPGELSCCYETTLKMAGASLGFEHLTVLGLVNDAHGYILQPEAWDYKTNESALSFGGKFYGERVIALVIEQCRHLVCNP
jgi:hypothetical protein